jgi:glycerophosphoryl diester phosphodiesterase
MGTHIENTIPSFRAAIDAGAEAVELDVQLDATGELVVFHDSSLAHLAGLDAGVAEVSSDELRSLELRSESLQGQVGRICLLDELVADSVVADALSDGLLLCVEIKAREAAAAAVEWVKSANVAPQTIIYSFHAEDLVVAKQITPDIKTNYLFGGDRDSALEVARSIGAWSCNPEWDNADEGFVAEATREGIGVSVGNTNDAEELRRVLALDVWGVHTNYPERALAERESLTV